MHFRAGWLIYFRFRKMALGVLSGLVCLALPLFPAIATAQTPVASGTSPPVGLAAQSDIEHLPCLAPDTAAWGQSSFDRTGANFDNGNYLYTDGHGDNVMASQIGPGCVYRIWMTDLSNSDSFKVYLDGNTTPLINTTAGALFNGTVANISAFAAPFVGNGAVSGSGYFVYLPIAYNSSIIITTNATDYPYYNIQGQTYGKDTPVTTWTGTENTSTVGNQWANITQDPKSASPNAVTVSGNVNLTTNAALPILDVQGPQSISAIKLTVPGVTTGGPASSYLTDSGYDTQGNITANFTINSANSNVTITRRVDMSQWGQVAGVYVNGNFAGNWTDDSWPSHDVHVPYRWVNDSFTIPSNLTAGLSNITVTFQFVAGHGSWDMYTTWIYSYVSGNEVLTDTLYPGNSISETAHNFVINNETGSGSLSQNYYNIGTGVANLTNLSLQIYWDGNITPAVNAPLGALFGIGRFGPASTVNGLLMGIDANNTLYLYFPMPFAQHARMTLTNNGPEVDGIGYNITYHPFTDNPATVGYFHAQFNSGNNTAGDGKDYVILNTAGAGKYVGLNMSLQGTGPIRFYLEGDEHIWVDGSSTPVIQGTGTEDSFNGENYWQDGPFSQPLSGFTGRYITLPFSFDDQEQAYRLSIGDAVSFRNGLVVTIEHGDEEDSTTFYQSCAYYYQAPTPMATTTDTLNLGDATSESAHGFVITGTNSTATHTYSYEGGSADDVSGGNILDNLTMSGVIFNGSEQFTANITPSNNGLILRRTFDQSGTPPTNATVYLDGQLVGTWNQPRQNIYHSWRDDDFMIPASFTSGKSSVTVKIASTNWNDYNFTVLSTAATLPFITDSPSSQTLTAGQRAAFDIGASGGPPPTFQWQLSADNGITWGNLTDGNGISGSATANLTIANTTFAMSGDQFRALAVNVAGTTPSSSAILTVNTPPVITAPPSNTTLTAGQDASFTTSANGSPVPTFQWQLSTDNSTTWGNLTDGNGISGSATDNLTIANTTFAMSGSQFRVLAINVASTTASSSAILTVNMVPVITAQPSNLTLTAEQEAIFASGASGSPAPTFQWQLSADNGTTWGNLTDSTGISGSATANLTIASTLFAMSGDQFRVVAANIAGTVTSNASILTVNPLAPSITTPPGNQTVTAGQSAQFTVVTNADPAPSYQWQLSTDNGITWANLTDSGNISGSTTSSLTISNTTFAQNLNQFRALAINLGGSVTSPSAILTVQTLPAFLTQPGNQTISVGQTATFAVAASGNPAPAYLWQISNNGGLTWANLTDGAGVTGSATAKLSIANTNLGMSQREFRAIATNIVGSILSKTVILIVISKPAIITTSSTNTTGIVGHNLTLSVTAGGSPPLKYQWQFNGRNISGATGPAYTILGVKTSSAGKYDVIVTNASGHVTSPAINLTVLIPVSLTTLPKTATIKAGATAKFTITATGSKPITYQWQFNGGIPKASNISGAKTSTLTITHATSANAGPYLVIVTNPAGPLPSSSVTLTVK